MFTGTWHLVCYPRNVSGSIVGEGETPHMARPQRPPRPNARDWANTLSVGGLILGVSVLVPPKLGQGDLLEALMITGVVIVIAIGVCATGWLIDWLTRS